MNLNPSLLFWCDVLFATANAGLGLWWALRRGWLLCLVAGGAFALSAASVGMLWNVWGVCLLPHPAVVEFREGMTLCPGQSAQLRIELRIPRSGRDL